MKWIVSYFSQSALQFVLKYTTIPNLFRCIKIPWFCFYLSFFACNINHIDFLFIFIWNKVGGGLIELSIECDKETRTFLHDWILIELFCSFWEFLIHLFSKWIYRCTGKSLAEDIGDLLVVDMWECEFVWVCIRTTYRHRKEMAN